MTSPTNSLPHTAPLLVGLAEGFVASVAIGLYFGMFNGSDVLWPLIVLVLLGWGRPWVYQLTLTFLVCATTSILRTTPILHLFLPALVAGLAMNLVPLGPRKNRFGVEHLFAALVAMVVILGPLYFFTPLVSEVILRGRMTAMLLFGLMLPIMLIVNFVLPRFRSESPYGARASA